MNEPDWEHEAELWAEKALEIARQTDWAQLEAWHREVTPTEIVLVPCWSR